MVQVVSRISAQCHGAMNGALECMTGLAMCEVFHCNGAPLARVAAYIKWTKLIN